MIPYNPVKVLMLREYSAESSIDIDEDVNDAINESNLPVDKHGFFRGTLTVEITWQDDEE
jgi:hypothetical protein